MKVVIGKKGTSSTWQQDFPETMLCDCAGRADMALAVIEEGDEQEQVSNLHNSTSKEGFWPHDVIAIAVYFCRKCCKPLIKYNQA